MMRGPTGPKRKALCKRGHDLAQHRRERVNGSTYCQACLIEKAKERYGRDETFRNKSAERRQATWLTYKYGMGLEDFQALLVSQGAQCAICGIAFIGIKICVDHDHATDAVRGLLCHHCNIGLGCFKDRTDLLQNAVRYLEA
jgi:hypothetical protein